MGIGCKVGLGYPVVPVQQMSVMKRAVCEIVYNVVERAENFLSPAHAGSSIQTILVQKLCQPELSWKTLSKLAYLEEKSAKGQNFGRGKAEWPNLSSWELGMATVLSTDFLSM